MTVNRAQYLQGNTEQGVVLAGQPRAVKQGAGVLIYSGGSITFNFKTSSGILLLNNPLAVNSYVWPDVQGLEGYFIGPDGSENGLVWFMPKGLVALGDAPYPTVLGEQWFSYDTAITYVFQDKGGVEEWKPEFQGLDPLADNCTASPSFSSGDGTDINPYYLESAYSVSGDTVFFSPVITIGGLAPFQYLPIMDVNGAENGQRFQVTNSFANQDGECKFKLKFIDSGRSVPNRSYTALLQCGFDSHVFITTSVLIVEDLTVQNAGLITGNPFVGELLTYSVGYALGGVPPYSYTWVWKSEAGNKLLQSNGNTYVIDGDVAGDRIFVLLTAVDSQSRTASNGTSPIPAPPAVIGKKPFPNTDILFPATIPGVAATPWLDESLVLRARGCIEFATDGLTFSQGPTSIANGGTITTRWIDSPTCGGAEHGSTIVGCVYSDSYEECSSLLIDRIPSSFSFSPITDATPGFTYSSLSIRPVGFNATCYVTYNGLSTGINIQASTNEGVTWSNVPLIGGTSIPLNPNGTLRVRLTTGLTLGAEYTGVINLGVGNTVQSATFSVTNYATVPIIPFNTQIAFPITTTQEIASPAWSALDGSTTLTASGCIQFKVGSGGVWKSPGDAATAITTGNILYTRWSNTTPGVCGNSVHGTHISGTITSPTKTAVGNLTIDRVPATFSFTNLVNQPLSSVITSDTINIVGINAPGFVTLGGSSTLGSIETNINGSGWVTVPPSGETLSVPPVATGPGSSIQVRGSTGSPLNTSYSAIVNIGQNTSIASTTWTVVTTSELASIVTPSIVTPANGTTNINPTYTNPAGILVTSSAYAPINGAGSHISSDWEIYTLVSGSPVYIVQSNDDPVNLTSYTIPLSSLTVNTTYYSRVRYKTDSPSSLSSQWSNVSQFTSSSSFSLQFVPRLAPGISSLGGLAAATNPASGGYTIIVGSGGYGFRTLDGITFTPTASLSGTGVVDRSGIAYGNGKFITVGYGSQSGGGFGTINVLGSTTNGSSWSSSGYDNASLAGSGATSIAYSPTLDMFCIVGLSGKLYTSPGSSINWTQRSTGTVQNLQSVIWDGNAFRACGGTAYLSSTNGTSWNLTTIALSPDGFGLGQITYNPNLGIYYMTRGYVYDSSITGSIYGLRSVDGSTWQSVTAPAKLETVASGGSWFVAGSSVTDTQVLVYTSNDALTWTLNYTNNSYFHVHGIHFIPAANRFMFSAHNWVLFSST